ncbi:hypothetical protein Val02_24970 [Virgisporangium aliadipatigenens]|uniref:GrpE protein n=1 Tax=Virgisporangium aliadipatigenens TaxID=741659 RepID=A0A8J4DQ63_9ACTN|nr:nucleotide exchange factor GrpE [Virgisporangium aliadipatigenens]GIJ45611.1 hypothetical protein Val02_24970 [Virgisporangium aliadipatigenens]
MSPNSLRVLAGAAAAVLALVTAIVVGLVSRSTPPGCPPNGADLVPAVATTAPAQPTAQPSPTSGGLAPRTATPTADSNFGDAAADKSKQDAQAQAQAQAQAEARARADKELADCKAPVFSPFPALAALLGAGVTGLITLVILVVAGRSVRRPVGAVAPVSGAPTSAPPVNAHTTQRSGGGDGSRTEADRAALVRACIYVRDRVTSKALSDRLNAALADAGVTSVEPLGDRFDPARHEAGGTTPTKDPTQAGTIAAVEVPGYTDRTGRVLRPPIVTVYQTAAGRSTNSRANEEDR